MSMRHWINLVEARRPKATPSQWEIEKAKLDADDAAFAAELATRSKYRNPFKELERAAEADGFYPATAALSDAETNAGETAGVEYDSAEYWRTALDSISATEPFNSDSQVQDWFKNHGYSW